ncbi:MAG: hypothetical protein PVF58_17385 [Candidatus Methanofastidiosia archaeon]|jgi:hypothetical protein
MITSGEGKYTVWLKQEKIGKDRVYLVGGGETPHVGGCVIVEPGNKAYIVKLGSHYDHVVLQPIAEEASKKYEVTAVALGGIHIDNATKEEIDILVYNCKELIKCI